MTDIVHAHFTPYPGQGNAGFYEMTRCLRLEGFNVTAIAAGRKGEKKKENVNGVHVVRIPVATVRKKSFSNVIYLIKCFTLLKKIRPDIGHLYSSLGMGLIPLFAGKPPVWICDIRSLGFYEGIRAKAANCIIRTEARSFDALIALDHILFQILYKTEIPPHCYVVPLGADFQKFHPGTNEDLRKQLNITDDDTCIVYVGSMHQKRELSKVLLAFSDVCKDFECKLLMIGEGSDLDNLKNVAEQLLLQDRVIFKGYVPFEEVPHYLRASDIAVAYIPNTPRYSVQLLSKTVEYLACSLPTVATNTRGNQTFINHGFNGLLCKDDPQSLSDSMKTLLENESLRKKLSSHARKSVEDFDWHRIVKHVLIPIYETLL